MTFRGKSDAFESEDEWAIGLFLSLFNYTVGKNQRLREIIKTIPPNSTYTSPDMQNKLIAAMSSVITEDVKREIGNSWYTVKVVGTKDPNGVENISIIIRFLTSTNSSDAKSITDVILTELTKAELTSSKILSHIYDGASVMAGHCEEVQRLLQERESRKIFLCALPESSIAPL